MTSSFVVEQHGVHLAAPPMARKRSGPIGHSRTPSASTGNGRKSNKHHRVDSPFDSVSSNGRRWSSRLSENERANGLLLKNGLSCSSNECRNMGLHTRSGWRGMTRDRSIEGGQTSVLILSASGSPKRATHDSSGSSFSSRFAIISMYNVKKKNTSW